MFGVILLSRKVGIQRGFVVIHAEHRHTRRHFVDFEKYDALAVIGEADIGVNGNTEIDGFLSAADDVFGHVGTVVLLVVRVVVQDERGIDTEPLRIGINGIVQITHGFFYRLERRRHLDFFGIARIVFRPRRIVSVIVGRIVGNSFRTSHDAKSQYQAKYQNGDLKKFVFSHFLISVSRPVSASRGTSIEFEFFEKGYSMPLCITYIIRLMRAYVKQIKNYMYFLRKKGAKFIRNLSAFSQKT